MTPFPMEVEQLSQAPDRPCPERPQRFVRQRGKDVFLFAISAVVYFILTRGAISILQSPARGLPYADRFATGDNSEWSAYGGNWKVEAGSMVNESNERGAKLVAGSAYWTDYTVQADVALLSPGDAGLIARVSDPEQGVDAYNGIYVGLRIRDQGLVLGIADHNWQEAVTQPLSSPILPNTWYHFQVQLRGCRISAIVHRQDASEMGRAEFAPASCPLRGKIGLRSYDSGGMWKNVRVTRLVSPH